MKKPIVIFLSLIMLMSCAASAEQTSDVWATLEEAYVYAFPLVLMDATKTSATNTETPVTGKAPVNQFDHRSSTLNAKFKTVVTPNVDTVYSQVWLEFAEEPIIYTMPAADRFFNVQLLDGWTNTVSVLTEPGVYAFTRSDWQGELPEGMTRVDFPTQMGWFIARCLLLDEDDVANVEAIHAEMDIKPLSAYVSGEPYVPAHGTRIAENDFIPVDHVFAMTPAAFFAKANELMLTNPPAADDAEKLEKIAAVNVGPGMTFDMSVMTGDIAAKWTEMLTGLRTRLVAAGMQFNVAMGQWSYFGRPIGNFGTEYDYRALIALGGLGANTLDVAMYTQTNKDENGESMSGDHVYQIHFETMPPVLGNGFWSVTAYGSDDFLIDNPLNRYAITDRSAFELNEDGTLDIIVSATEPEKNGNWLPVNEDEFHLYMRIYTPDMEAIETWDAPTISILQ